jgi:hypothetical protein
MVAFASTSALASLRGALHRGLSTGLARARRRRLPRRRRLAAPARSSRSGSARRCRWFLRREVGWPRLALRLGLVAAIALVILAPWLQALWRFRDLRDSTPTPFLAASWKDLVMDFFSDRGYRRPFDRQTYFHAELMLLGLGAITAWRRRCRR